jgi:ribosomal RNA-processing protein 9
MWKLASTLKSFSLVGTISAPGVVNSLQFVSPRRSFAWASPSVPSSEDANSEQTKRVGQHSTVLLVAGLGQEHRLGRWLKVKDGGARNEAVVFALRTSS